jgi:protein-tyrosine-phosphatase
MKKVIFIDRGNILRSPIAKAIYNSLKQDGSFAFSYGTNVREQENEGLLLCDYSEIADTLVILESHGLDLSQERCVQLLPEHLENAAKIIVMTEQEDIPKWLEEYGYEYWEIPNPELVTKEVAENIFLLLRDKISSLR